ncbi:recombinase family protein [Francisella philomiragia]
MTIWFFLLLNDMFVGYARVSKADGTQSLNSQIDELINFGIDPQYIYQDLASGKKDDRPGLTNCLKALQPGNTLVVWKLDRLGRNMKHLISLIDELKSKGVGFKVLSGAGAEIDTTTSNGRLVFGIFAALAEFEREIIRERTQAGLAAARARGKNGGRPRKMDIHKLRIAMQAMSDPKNNPTIIAKNLGITPTTLYTYVNGDGSPKELGIKIIKESEK